ncbi:winged helix-turn-helix domain-containing protein [uncultured Paraglaciecola sp.]|uniref:winged helix-turn-helix domain-containing protein n=1 Tax=uncultured Paraglaciecola sp. TaxID=1765024 RepID=UPI0030D75B0D|tara:strand:- start:50699 stop:52777 length:2079 start_codon:yes stop_codon:yes gene_type:complete
MRWQIEAFLFCEKQQTLSSEQEVLQLEPMVVELLAYFCRHTNQIVSRDQLIEEVWQGRVITDNAVTKVINKLRKNLNDDPRKPRFIATLPKKGYKFIAAATELLEENTATLANHETSQISATKPSAQISPLSKEKLPIIWPLIVFGLMVLVVWLLVLFQNDKAHSPITQVKALTRSAGNEAWPQVSPDGNYLAFMEFGENKVHLWVKSLIDEKSVEITHGEKNALGVGPAAWNSDGSKLVYLVASSDSCQYYIREINGLTLGEPKLIHNCPAGSYGRISFTHDDNRVVYSESDNSPYTLFELNLVTGVKRRLNQPEQFIGGNSQFDLHPTQNILLISSPDKQQWEGYYSLDLETDELTLLFKQDAYICCGIWDHSGERVVLMGEHPAYQLVSYDQHGKDKQVLYSGSQQLRTPLRHANGKDYMFIAGYMNQNALYYNFESQSDIFVANTSVDDRLAVFSPHDNQIAFIGLSTGNEEVWFTDRQGSQLTKLTQFNDSRHFISLLWSFSGDYLLGLTLNQIYLINSKTGNAEALRIPQVEIRGLSWKSEQVISYSTKGKNGWLVNYYDLNTHQVSYEDEKWAFIQYSEDPDDVLWQAQNGDLFVTLEQTPVLDKELNAVNFLSVRQFNLKKVGANWAWQNFTEGQYHLMLKEGLDNTAKMIVETGSYHFDLSNEGLLYHSTDKLNADIYQTVAK